MFFLTKIEDHLLPCLNKKLFGFECMGCGFQRATVLLFKGEFVAAFKMYPALYPLIILLVFLGYSTFFKVKHANKITITLIIITISFILGNFTLKLINH